MVGAVVHGNMEVHNLETAQRAVLGGLADTGVDRRDEFLRDGAADGVVAEGVALARLDRGDLDPAVTVLAVTTGLTDVAAFGLRRLADGLTIGNLRRADGRLNLELAQQTVNDDLQMEYVLKVWSSSARRSRPRIIFSWLALVFGSIAT